MNIELPDAEYCYQWSKSTERLENSKSTEDGDDHLRKMSSMKEVRKSPLMKRKTSVRRYCCVM